VTDAPPSAADVAGRTLARLGVQDAFAVIGSGNFVVTQAMDAAGARVWHARHENGALCMADASARVSGRVGVCSVHQGLGFTNMLTGLTEAAKSGTPLLVVAADTPADAPRSNFKIDQDGIAQGLGAIAERMRGRRAAEGITVRRVEDLAAVAAWLERPRGPRIADAKVCQGVVAEWLEEAFR
jgi:thiamine pyrophosphate-dependent acetolactate synthase large subunit-like protein